VTNNSSKAFRNVPPPPNSKAASSYTRFIPREELGEFAAWSPDSLSDGGERPAAPAAAPIEETVEQQIAAARQSGYQDGYRDGLVALENFKQNFAAKMTGQIGPLLESFEQQLGGLEASIAAAVASTASQLARQVLRTELKSRPEVVALVASEAVQAVLLSARHISVRLHPKDMELVAAGAGEALEARQARLIADPAVGRGGCVVDSDIGAVDARVATRWAQAAAALDGEADWTETADAEDDGEATPP
jgi:flagellar assembly protein FliH